MNLVQRPPVKGKENPFPPRGFDERVNQILKPRKPKTHGPKLRLNPPEAAENLVLAHSSTSMYARQPTVEGAVIRNR